MIKIKPCPHCGGTAQLQTNYNWKIGCYFTVVKCDICGAQGKTFCFSSDNPDNDIATAIKADAVNAWNMRFNHE